MGLKVLPMREFDPCSDAEWMLETIIDDFAQSLTPTDRALFYTHLAELLARRGRDEEISRSEPDGEPELPPPVQ